MGSPVDRMNKASQAGPGRRGKTIWYVHPYAGGPGIGRFGRPYYLARNWQSQAIDTTIFCPTFHHLLDTPQSGGARDVDGVPYHFVDARAYRNNGFGRLANMAEFSWHLLRQADRLIASYGRPDVIIASSPHPYVFLATHRIARRYNAVSIFEVRDLWPLSLVELAGVSPKHPLVVATAWLERYAYRKADHVVSLHPNSAPYMHTRGVRNGRWHYIPNGVDALETPLLVEDEPAYRRLLQWRSEGKFVVLYAGALGPPNNIDVLVEAARTLRARSENHIRVLIVGRGEVQSRIAAMIESLDLGDRVGLYPQVPKAHAIGLMTEADAGYISLKPERIFEHGVSPNKLHDYMLARLPIISAMKAGNDPVTEAGCGLSVEPGNPLAVADAMVALASLHHDKRAAMGDRGHQFVRGQHDYANLALRYAELFGV